MREHLATLLEDFRHYDRQVAVVRTQGNRRRVTTYGELAQLAGRFATLLAKRRIGPGDRVLLWAENSAEWVAAFHGCILRGALAVPLDAYGTAEFAARVAADVRPKLVVGDALLLGKLVGDWPRLTFEEWPAALPVEETGPVEGLSRETPLQILFTSGTTGDPKGVVLTHGNVLASVEPIEAGAQPYMRYEKPFHPLRFLHTLPLSHVFGQTMGLWIPPIFAAQVFFESRLVAPRLIETIRKERISVLAAVPRVMALLKTHLETSKPTLASRLEAAKGIRAWKRWWRFRDVHAAFGFKFWALISGGGALAGPLEQFWNGLGFVVVQGYGMTETAALITLNHPFHVARGSIGKPLPGREVKLGADGEVLVRGATISGATWTGGALRPRESEWLSTGDLAEQQPGGELRFVGRKSEVIVTAAGVNLHPEDLEAAIEQEPDVAACAVVAMETANGPEPCAVLAMRGNGDRAAFAIEQANQRLAEFQRLRHWVLWPEPDLPRTSTGKVRRKVVSAWLEEIQTAAATGGTKDFGAQADWLLKLITEISGETPPGMGDELRLSEDLQLDSLGRVQLAAAIEERLGMSPESGLLEEVRTLGELRGLVAGDVSTDFSTLPDSKAVVSPSTAPGSATDDSAQVFSDRAQDLSGELGAKPPTSYGEDDESAVGRAVYPHWPWSKPFHWLRVAFIEAVERPLVGLLAHPKVVMRNQWTATEPMLIVANHVTAYDGPLVQYALDGPVRRRLAAAMSGEMLGDFRHFRNPNRGPRYGKFSPFGPLAYLALTALFNVFPLPRRQNFQRSFTHAGEALDRGFNVLVFPEGTRSVAGELARFRGGIGLLARQSCAPVLPVALVGLGELKAGEKGWFRSGKIEVRIGEPIRFRPEETEAAMTARLHAEVEKLLRGTRTEGTGISETLQPAFPAREE
jgi:long-chain acyl-CoA synthetase